MPIVRNDELPVHDVVHQLVHSGDGELVLVAALGMAPVRVRTADGEPLPVPWQAPSQQASSI